MSKLTRTIALSLGLAILPATATRAQLGDIGEAARKGATDAATKEVMQKAGLVTPSPSPTASPADASPTTAASSPTAAASPSPAVTPAKGASPASVGAASPAAEGGMGKMLMDQAEKKATDEAVKQMAPKVP